MVLVRAGNVIFSPDIDDGERLPDGMIADVVGLDDIIFSEPQIVPEPRPLVLLLAGLTLPMLVTGIGRLRRPYRAER